MLEIREGHDKGAFISHNHIIPTSECTTLDVLTDILAKKSDQVVNLEEIGMECLPQTGEE